MEFTIEAELIEHVLRIARRLGYTAMLHPSSSRSPRLRVLGWPVRSVRFKPDILVERGAKSVLVEAKIRPVLMSAVMQAHGYRNCFGIPIILCLPDSSFHSTPKSVKDFARRNELSIFPASKIADALRECLV